MKVTAMLAQHADALNNTLYVHGGGIERVLLEPGTPAPYGVTLAIAVIVHVPWAATNETHTLRIELVDADGRSVQVPNGPDTTTPLEVSTDFAVGRPPQLPHGADQSLAYAFNIPLLGLPALGTYRFVISVDGEPREQLPLTLQENRPAPRAAGPSSLPSF